MLKPVLTSLLFVQVTDSIHELMGSTSANNALDAHSHVERIFATMDLNQDGVITIDEFIQYCETTDEVRESMMVRTREKVDSFEPESSR